MLGEAKSPSKVHPAQQSPTMAPAPKMPARRAGASKGETVPSLDTLLVSSSS